MRYVSLFSGIEAASVAWQPLGWEPVAFSEIEPFPCALLAERFPDVPNLGDVTKIDWSDYAGKIDVVVGGSPCQSFSVAGKREGLKGESGLMLEYIRAVREVMPRYFVWENVVGALTSEKGAAFGQLLREMDDLGYGLAWRVLDAQFFGVAQRRRRLFLVGVLGSVTRAAEVLFEPQSLLWDTPASKDKRQELVAAARRCVEGGDRGGCLTPWDVQSKKIYGVDGVAPTLVSGTSEGMNIQPCVMINSYGFSYKTSPGSGSIGFEEEVAPSLLAARQDAAVISNGGDAVRALCARDHKGVGSQYVSDGKVIAQQGESGCIVRRLMPVECERLQGFPDGWTDVEFKGKPASDTVRYKALGNSMAVPVMRWIGQRMQLMEKTAGTKLKGA